jgi:hypothetical protein
MRYPDVFVWQRKYLKNDRPIKEASFPKIEDRLVLGRGRRYILRGETISQNRYFNLPEKKRMFLWNHFHHFYSLRKKKKRRFTKWHINKVCRSIGVAVE